MLAIEITFLTGRYVASSHYDRNRPEWPPHPARVFSALVAAWAESEDRPEQGRRVLEHLETLGPPDIAASGATERTVVTHYVPVNDVTVLPDQAAWARRLDAALAVLAQATPGSRDEARARKGVEKERDVSGHIDRAGASPPAKAVALLPAGRTRQARAFPTVLPDRALSTLAVERSQPSCSLLLRDLETTELSPRPTGGAFIAAPTGDECDEVTFRLAPPDTHRRDHDIPLVTPIRPRRADRRRTRPNDRSDDGHPAGRARTDRHVGPDVVGCR